MESIVIDLKNEKDKFLLLALAERLKLRSKIFTEEEKEEIGLINAMKEGRKTGIVDESEIMKKIDKNQYNSDDAFSPPQRHISLFPINY